MFNLSHRLVRVSAVRLAFLATMTLVSFPAWAAAHFLTLINDDMRSVAAIEAAPAGTSGWARLNIGGALVGGSSGQATVRFDPSGSCQQDIRVTFRDGPPLTVTGFNVCRRRVLHIGRAHAAARWPVSQGLSRADHRNRSGVGALVNR